MGFWGDGGLYGAWLDYLDRWTNSEVELTERAPQLKSDDLDSSTWYRLLLKIQEAVNLRLMRWQKALTDSLNAASDEFGWGQALIGARPGLRSILALTDLPELTEEIRSGLRTQVEAVIRSIQSQFEDDAQNALRRGHNRAVAEMQLRQLRRSSLLEALSSRPQADQTSLPPFTAPADSTGRRRRQILID